MWLVPRSGSTWSKWFVQHYLAISISALSMVIGWGIPSCLNSISAWAGGVSCESALTSAAVAWTIRISRLCDEQYRLLDSSIQYSLSQRLKKFPHFQYLHVQGSKQCSRSTGEGSFKNGLNHLGESRRKHAASRCMDEDWQDAPELAAAWFKYLSLLKSTRTFH